LDERRKQTRQAVDKHRKKVSQCKPSVSHGKPQKAQAEAEAEVEADRINTSCAEPEVSDSTLEGSPVAFSLPLNDGSDFQVSEAQVGRWGVLFPAVDVPQTLREMLAWLEANPTKRKTRRGAMRFVVAWLSREQDKGD
jgi:hypothetical protein